MIDDVAQCPPDRPAGTGCTSAALKADAENRARHIACQQRQLAAADCLRTLQERGVLRSRNSPARNSDALLQTTGPP